MSEPQAAGGSRSAGESVPDALGAPTALTPADFGRDIVYRATITVEVDDVAAASQEAVAIVQGLGGIVFAQTTRTEPQPVAEMTFKVRPGDFASALERLAGVGELVDQSISADDVTARIVDLESRITTAEVSVVRLRKLLRGGCRSSRTWPSSSGSCWTGRPPWRRSGASCAPCEGQVDLATITLTIYQSPDVLPDTAMLVTASVSDNVDDMCLGNQHVTVRARRHGLFLPGGRERRRVDPDRRGDQPGERGHRCRLLSRRSKAASIGSSPAVCWWPRCPSLWWRGAWRVGWPLGDSRSVSRSRRYRWTPSEVVLEQVSGYTSLWVEVVEEGSWPGFFRLGHQRRRRPCAPS